jgi:hypothetical protein
MAGRHPAPDGRRADLVALLTIVVLIAAAIVMGFVSRANQVPIHARIAPLFGDPGQQVGPGTPAAIALAVLAIGYGPAVAARLRWPALLLASWVTSVLWVFSLGLVAGWERMAGQLERSTEYLAEVPDAPPLPDLLATFTDRIVAGQPDSWTTHVAGHPPGALIFFILLDWLGLEGGAWAAIVVILLGSSGCVAVAVTLRALDTERLARRALPFLVLAPAAIWIGVTGDAVFLAVSAWGLALLAVATRSSGPRLAVAAAAAGLLLGITLYLSYGLVLIGLVALAVLVVSRRLLPGVIAGLSVLSVVTVVTIAGFSWWDGMDQVVVRYYQGWGTSRPYSYWVWANLAALAIATGPAVAPGLRRVAAGTYRAIRARALPPDGAPTAALVLAAALAVLLADLSGLSKGEVERIWLPFALWLIAAAAFLPRRDHRWWLALQALTALVVVHLTLPAF